MYGRFFRSLPKFQPSIRLFQTLAPLVGLDDRIAIFNTDSDKQRDESSADYQARCASEAAENAWPFSLEHDTDVLCIQLRPTVVMPVKNEENLTQYPHLVDWPSDDRMNRFMLPEIDRNGDVRPGKESIYPGHVAILLGTIGPNGLSIKPQTFMSKIPKSKAKKEWYQMDNGFWSFRTQADYQGQHGAWSGFFLDQAIPTFQQKYVKQFYIFINMNRLNLSLDDYMERLNREINEEEYDIMTNACGQSVMKVIINDTDIQVSPQTAVLRSIEKLALDTELYSDLRNAFNEADIYGGDILGDDLAKVLDKKTDSLQHFSTLK